MASAILLTIGLLGGLQAPPQVYEWKVARLPSVRGLELHEVTVDLPQMQYGYMVAADVADTPRFKTHRNGLAFVLPNGKGIGLDGLSYRILTIGKQVDPSTVRDLPYEILACRLDKNISDALLSDAMGKSGKESEEQSAKFAVSLAEHLWWRAREFWVARRYAQAEDDSAKYRALCQEVRKNGYEFDSSAPDKRWDPYDATHLYVDQKVIGLAAECKRRLAGESQQIANPQTLSKLPTRRRVERLIDGLEGELSGKQGDLFGTSTDAGKELIRIGLPSLPLLLDCMDNDKRYATPREPSAELWIDHQFLTVAEIARSLVWEILWTPGILPGEEYDKVRSAPYHELIARYGTKSQGDRQVNMLRDDQPQQDNTWFVAFYNMVDPHREFEPTRPDARARGQCSGRMWTQNRYESGVQEWRVHDIPIRPYCVELRNATEPPVSDLVIKRIGQEARKERSWSTKLVELMYLWNPERAKEAVAAARNDVLADRLGEYPQEVSRYYASKMLAGDPMAADDYVAWLEKGDLGSDFNPMPLIPIMQLPNDPRWRTLSADLLLKRLNLREHLFGDLAMRLFDIPQLNAALPKLFNSSTIIGTWKSDARMVSVISERHWSERYMKTWFVNGPTQKASQPAELGDMLAQEISLNLRGAPRFHMAWSRAQKDSAKRRMATYVQAHKGRIGDLGVHGWF